MTATLTDTRQKITARDRCDSGVKPAFGETESRSCSAAASVRVNLMSGILLFCGHHYSINQEALKKSAIQVEDFRRVEENRLVGSHN